MPPRWLSLTIVALWLGMNGCLMYSDLWPQWQPNQPPPFTIDLIEEVKTRDKVTVFWYVYQNDLEVFHARTWVLHREADVFELVAEFSPARGPHAAPAGSGPLKIRRLKSVYRVTQEGNLLGVSVEVQGQIAFGELLRGLGRDFNASLTGEVRQGRFYPHLRAEIPEDLAREADLPPVEVSHHGSVLLPLHPVNRIQGLRPGQTWRMPLVDPLADSLAVMRPGLGSGPRFLSARVLPERQMLPEQPRQPGPSAIPKRHTYTSCLVIEYQDEEMSARTWVEEDTGRVLLQEASSGGDRWRMFRD